MKGGAENPAKAAANPAKAASRAVRAASKADSSPAISRAKNRSTAPSPSSKRPRSNLGKGKGRAAEQDERNAIAQMKQALDELKKEKARIASLPPEAFDKMAKDQDRTADKTGDLDKQMAEASKSGQAGRAGKAAQGGERRRRKRKPAAARPTKRPAGPAATCKAPRATSASKNPKQATRKQQKAVDDLKKALEEIERRLAQLRREMQAEKLAALEAHFRTMLEIQKPITVGTKNYDRIRAQRQWTRPELLDVSKLSVKERELSVMAQQALDILVEDGTSVDFSAGRRAASRRSGQHQRSDQGPQDRAATRRACSGRSKTRSRS